MATVPLAAVRRAHTEEEVRFALGKGRGGGQAQRPSVAIARETLRFEASKAAAPYCHPQKAA